MHGTLIGQLRDEVDGRLGQGSWSELVDEPTTRMACAPRRAQSSAPAGSAGAELPDPVLLEEFGSFIAPSLLAAYQALLRPEWSMLDLLQSAETSIQQVVRQRNPEALPAELQAERVSTSELRLRYYSQRRLCPMAKGIIRGLSSLLDEPVAVVERQCVHHGAEYCELIVRVNSPR